MTEEVTPTTTTTDLRDITYPDDPKNIQLESAKNSINITWTKGNNSDYTLIEWSSTNISTWKRGDGTQLYNSTGTSTTHSSLTEDTQYYYKFWSYNQTDNTWSSGVEDSATTDYGKNAVSIETKEVKDITNNDATLVGDLTELNITECDVYFQYRVKGTSDWSKSDTKTLSSIGEFSIYVDELNNNTAYEYRTVARWESDTTTYQDTGNIKEFHTDKTPINRSIDIMNATILISTLVVSMGVIIKIIKNDIEGGMGNDDEIF